MCSLIIYSRCSTGETRRPVKYPIPVNVRWWSSDVRYMWTLVLSEVVYTDWEYRNPKSEFWTARKPQMATVEREPVNGVRGRSPQWDPGTEALVSGRTPPLKLKALNVNFSVEFLWKVQVGKNRQWIVTFGWKNKGFPSDFGFHCFQFVLLRPPHPPRMPVIPISMHTSIDGVVPAFMRV